MIEHLGTEKHQKICCLYCKRDLEKKEWKSEFSGGTHYKTTKCECGQVVRIPVEFGGSGHDNWSGKEEKKTKNNIKTIESKINVVKEINEGHT